MSEVYIAGNGDSQRPEMQTAIDGWHSAHAMRPHDPVAYRALLESIGYIAAAGPEFQIDTAEVDPEIASVAGPQLVVPATNARYVLNAANKITNLVEGVPSGKLNICGGRRLRYCHRDRDPVRRRLTQVENITDRLGGGKDS